MDKFDRKFNPESTPLITGHIIQLGNKKYEIDSNTGEIALTDPSFIKFILQFGIKVGEKVTLVKNSEKSSGEVTEIDPVNNIFKIKLAD